MANPIFAQMGATIFEHMSRLAASEGAINLGQGFPEGLEPRALLEAAARATVEGPHQYPSMLGLPVLRQAVAANARRFWGLELDWEREVLITSGATEALADVFFALIEAGDEVILFEPAYDSYAPIIRRAGGAPVPVRLSPPDWRLPLEALQAAITPRTRLIVVNTPMNPTGKVFDADELAALADLLTAHDLIAVCDEVYEHLVLDGRHASLMAWPGARDRVVRIGSAGKSFSVTGWKVGYVCADPGLLGPISRAHQYMTFTTPPALQMAVAEGLALPDSYFEELKASLRARRDRLADGLRRAGFEVLPAPATYFLIAATGALDPAQDDRVFCERITREAKVAAVPLSPFFARGEERGFARFCFAKTEATLEAAIDRLTAWAESART